MNETGFEDVTWDMAATDLLARYPAFHAAGSVVLGRRMIGTVPVEVSFHVGDGGLDRIELVVLRQYKQWGDADDDEATLVDWIARSAGPYADRDAGSVRWRLPAATIRTFVDQSMTVRWKRVIAS